MPIKSNTTVKQRRSKDREKLLECLKRMPVIQVACEKTGISRATYYRWRNEDKEFRKTADAAIDEGEALITDMSESQLISMIRDRNFPAVQLWLKHHHPKYGNKVEITGGLRIEDEPLTPEQEILIAEAIRLGGLNSENHEPEPIKGNSS